MITKEQIDRINALARKSREQDLTPAEQAEQAELRALYIASVKANLTAQLENTVIQTPDGTRHRLNRREKP